MVTDVKLDYSGHAINADKQLQDVLGLLRRNDYKNAVQNIDHVIVELRLMKAAVNSLQK